MNLLYLQDSFNAVEMACIVSYTDPIEIEICQNDTNFTQNYSHYFTALNFIRNLIDNGTLDYSTKADQFKSMLNSKGIVIDGFNSNIELTKANNEHELSQDEINHLTTELQQAHSEIDRLKAELEQAQTLLAEKPKIEYVEVKDNRLETLLDEQGKYYAPDLAHAVNLWLSLYGNGKIKDDSHTNLSQVWIKHNTGYHDQQDGYTRTLERIQGITTPFKEWATARNKNYRK